jgi:hypothetical protein
MVELQGNASSGLLTVCAYQDSLQKLCKCTNLLHMQRDALPAESNLVYHDAYLRLFAFR